MTVGQTIRFHRQRLGLTLQALAIDTGFSVEHLSRIETGAKPPTLPALQRIADALGFAVEIRFADPADDTHKAHPTVGGTARLLPAATAEKELV